MQRLLFWFLLGCGCLVAPLGGRAAPDDDPRTFEGAWKGEIRAPGKSPEFGLAFTRTPEGLLVSVHFPEMFLYSTNFGPAEISESTFTLPALKLRVQRRGEALVGTFGAVAFPLELRRTDAFSPPPAEPEFPSAPEPRWTRSLSAAVWASPAEFNGVLYVAAVDGRVHALRTADGTPLWTWEGPQAIYGQPFAAETAVYVLDERCELFALSVANGAVLWRTPLHDETLAPRPAGDPTFNHRAAAPVLDNRGLLYVGSTDGGLYAVRASNGRKLWRHPAKAAIYAPVTVRGEEIVVGTFDGSLFSLDRRTRREAMRTQLGGPIVSAPAVAPDRIVVGSRDMLLYGLNAKGKEAWRVPYWFSWVESSPRLEGETIYVGGSDYRRVSAFDLRTGRELWAVDVRGLSWGSPVVSTDTVFAGAAGQTLPGTVIQHVGGIFALDRSTGRVRWRYAAPAKPGSDFSGFAGSLVHAAGLVIGASVDGSVMAFPAGPAAH